MLDSYTGIIEERDTTELLKRLLRIKSMSGEENELANFVGRWLQARGMETEKDRHGNLYAEYRFGEAAEEENAGPVVLFNTHLDNVPIGEGWERSPFGAEEEDGIVYGRGACDPKGALAAMMTAAAAMIQDEKEREKTGLPKRNGTLLLMAAVTEEISPPSAKGTWKAVKDGLVKADMAVCGEPTDNLPCIGEFGKMEYEIITHGKPAHASAPEQGVNAILHLSRLLLELDRRAERRWSELLGRKGTLNVGMISGGVQINIVAETARAKVERRLVPGQTAQESMDEMKRICDSVKAELPELNYEILVAGEGNAALISEEEPVARLMNASVEAVTGKRPGPKGFVAHADADWLITYGKIPTVIYGPGSLSDAHTCREKVKTADVAEAANVLAEFLNRAFSGEAS